MQQRRLEEKEALKQKINLIKKQDQNRKNNLR